MQISDVKQYRKYMVAPSTAVAAACGEYLVRGDKFETLEGNWKSARIEMPRSTSYKACQNFL
jgi:uncharacterized protein (DUF1330 family)